MRRLTASIGLGLIAVSITIAGVTNYLNSKQREQNLIFAQQAMLAQLWDTSKKDQVEAGSNRTVDRMGGNVTTSEGESYTMLRSVWSDDRTTFDKAWTWTKDNLQRPSDSLFSWRYGQLGDGSYGILTDVGGQNTASDADTDIALSLIMASQRWHEQKYLSAAQPVIQNIWKQEVVQINGKPVLAADNVERSDPNQILVNPSYFAPYAYKVFAQIDKTHNWSALRDNSYTILAATQAAHYDKTSTDHLIPNWIVINRDTGKISAASGPNLDTNYGYDAMRTPFRLALDYAWFKDSRDKSILNSMVFLADSWKNSGSLASVYSHDFGVIEPTQAPAIYGGNIGYFQITNPTLAKQIYDQKLASLFNPNSQDWKSTLNYYDDNWAWFGLALYGHALTNLTGVK